MEENKTSTETETNELLRPDHELPAPHDMLLEPGDAAAAKKGEDATTMPATHKKSRSFPLWIFPLIGFLLVVIALGMYYVGQMRSTSQSVTQNVINTPSPTATPIPDPMDGWLTFITPTLSFKYPPEYRVEEKEQGFFTIIKDGQLASSSAEVMIDARLQKNTTSVTKATIATRNMLAKGFSQTTVPNGMQFSGKIASGYGKDIPVLITVLSYKTGALTVESSGATIDTSLHNQIVATLTAVGLSPTQTASNSAEQVMCTMDAKQCSDGSFVSRTGPNCEFAACPKR